MAGRDTDVCRSLQEIESLRARVAELEIMHDEKNVFACDMAMQVSRLREALEVALPIVEEAYWDQHTAGTLPGSGYNHKAQSLAGWTWGWQDSAKFKAWLAEARAALNGACEPEPKASADKDPEP